MYCIALTILDYTVLNIITQHCNSLYWNCYNVECNVCVVNTDILGHEWNINKALMRTTRAQKSAGTVLTVYQIAIREVLPPGYIISWIALQHTLDLS